MHPLTQLIKITKHSLRAMVADKLTKEDLQALVELVEKGVEVMLVLSTEVEDKLGIDPYTLNRIILINKKGGAVYFASPDEIDGREFYITDHSDLSLRQNGQFTTFSDTTAPTQVRNYSNLFDELIADKHTYLSHHDDLKVEFDISDKIILEGDTIKLSWNVTNAQKVIVQNVGEVANTDHIRLKPAVNTIFKIGAYNEQQTCVRTVCVKVYKDLNINYDLSFINRTGQETSLIKESNYPHVYGVAKSNEIKFSWDVGDVSKVEITPFGFTQPTGEYRFTPTESTIISLKVNAFHQEFVRDIQLLVFPIKVFKQKLVNNINIPNQLRVLSLKQRDSNKLFKEIKDTQYSHNQSLKEILTGQEQKYQELNQQIQELIFDNSDKKYNLYHVNESVFTKLQRFYGKKTHISEVIQSIKSYYDRPRKRE